MNKILGAAALVAAALTLTACTTGPDQNKVDAYRTVVHAMPAYADVSNDNLDKVAKGVCGIFKAAESTGWDVALEGAQSSGADSKQAAILVTAAVRAYCPQYDKDLQ